MRRFKKIVATLTTAALIGGLTLAFNACTQNGPTESASSSRKTPRFLKLIDSNKALGKIIQKSKFINKNTGGLVKLEYEADDGDLDYEVEISLLVLPGTLTQDVTLSLAIDDEDFATYMDATFAPHGTTFSTPAILNIDVEDLDLSGFDLNSLGLYYDNPETGQWELMEYDAIYVDESDGEVEVVNAKLPHFSRYAIGGE